MFKLPELPYEKNALEPYISAETLEYHHWKHHQAYVNNLNNLTVWSDLWDSDLENLIKILLDLFLIMPHKYGIIHFIGIVLLLMRDEILIEKYWNS